MTRSSDSSCCGLADAATWHQQIGRFSDHPTLYFLVMMVLSSMDHPCNGDSTGASFGANEEGTPKSNCLDLTHVSGAAMKNRGLLSFKEKVSFLATWR